MKIIYSDMPMMPFGGHSIFLAGPTPRDNFTPSWRPNALKILEDWRYTGTVLVPEQRKWNTDYLGQVDWEEEGLTVATRIVFWVPRSLPYMPAFTTNVEFGRWIMKRPRSITYGRPYDAVHHSYLDWLYWHELKKKPLDTLQATLMEALNENDT